jgi:hypothetical protein
LPSDFQINIHNSREARIDEREAEQDAIEFEPGRDDAVPAGSRRWFWRL